MQEIKKYISEYALEFNSRLSEFFPISTSPEHRVVEAMKYSISNGGKRLRPFLVYETSKLFGIDFEQSLRTAVSLECVHSYSLIHDDLPAMDNDDLRRGKASCHKAFDEATAILAGDGLLTYAFEILSDVKTHPKAAIRIELISQLSNAAGAFNGMVSGQMLDLYAERPTEQISDNLIKHIEEMKTGRLIKYACEAGAILGEADENSRISLSNYARRIGIAFQIADDILDVKGQQDIVGKKLNKDKAQGKATFVSLYGLEQAQNMEQQYIDEAKTIVSQQFGENSNILQKLADFIIQREY